MTQSFTGKVVLITGAAGGLGSACAVRLAHEGASLVLADREIEAFDGGILAEVESAGADALTLAVDITDPAAADDMVRAAVSRFGRLDCAINNAGVSPRPEPVGDYDLATWDSTVDVNLRGTFLCLRAELAQMSRQGNGAVVNVASTAALRVQIRGVAAYAASKHGIAGLTKAAARDYASLGIRVNALCPGHLRTPMLAAALAADPTFESSLAERIPMGRIGEPAEVAGTAVFLISDDASFVTGETLTADGGVTI